MDPMEEIVRWIAGNSIAVWVIAGLVLLASEMLVPGIYLLWLGLAALATALVHAVIGPDMATLAQVAVFSGFATISIYGGYQYFYRNGQNTNPEEGAVNRRGAQHVGEIYSVFTAIQGGRGKVSVGDSQWLASGPDCPVGARVRVMEVRGTMLVVQPVLGEDGTENPDAKAPQTFTPGTAGSDSGTDTAVDAASVSAAVSASLD